MMKPEIIENLRKFGLTEYEAKAYAALVSAGTASVTAVSQLCDVPRSNLYAALESLNKKGFADIQQGRPVLFKAIDSKIALREAERKTVEDLAKAREDATTDLEKLSKEKSADVVPALIWGLRGINAVETKIDEMVSRAKKEIIINAPDVGIFGDTTIDELRAAKKRGVKIKIATQAESDTSRLKQHAIIRIREKIHGFDMVVDDRETLVAPAFPVVAAWVDNPEMTLQVKDFLNLVWKDSRVTK